MITMRSTEATSKGLVRDQARGAVEDLPAVERHFVNKWARRRMVTGVAIGATLGAAAAAALYFHVKK